MKVFVYGTLKQGHGNHRLLRESKLLGECNTPPAFEMINMGAFPGAVRGKEELQGEVYEVDEHTMERLDMLEGYPQFYGREIIPTEFGDAWIYTLKKHEYDSYPRVIGGSW
jgi:gamma-glutamylcyclotransferase (GGCT)/AIG2-like uncharacterized protein YtfP